MTDFVLLLIIFLAVGAGFLGVNLTVGRFLRPRRPNAAKATVYECGELPAGDPGGQFDLRFYVVALLFVVFDVEVAFLFPWAVVFGSATRAADAALPDAERAAALADLPGVAAADAQQLAWLAFGEFALFFGVLLVGFAYLWRRGDLEWVRSTAAQPGTRP